jgi:hypothetical protein
MSYALFSDRLHYFIPRSYNIALASLVYYGRASLTRKVQYYIQTFALSLLAFLAAYRYR